MKSLPSRSALAITLLVMVTGAHAESVSFEVMDSDTIVVGATTEKVTLKVTGFKNMSSKADAPEGTRLGFFSVSTNENNGQVAVTYGEDHKSQVVSNLLTGRIENGEGQSINTHLVIGTGSTLFNSNGTDWLVAPKTAGTSVQGNINTNGVNNLSPGIYPVTLRAALYLP